jgi:hypothetical protein
MTPYEPAGPDQRIDAIPATPPIMPGAIASPTRRAAWPAPIGIIAVVLGSCAVLQSGAGFFMPLITGLARNLPRPKNQPDPFAGMDDYMGAMLAVYAVGMLVAVVLIVAGAGVIRRRAWSGPAVLTWAVLKILYAVAYSVVMALVQKSQMEAVIASASTNAPPGSGPPPGLMSGLGVGIAAFTAIFLFIWLAALPVFMLIWFTRRAIKEEVASWRTPQVS